MTNNTLKVSIYIYKVRKCECSMAVYFRSFQIGAKSISNTTFPNHVVSVVPCLWTAKTYNCSYPNNITLVLADVTCYGGSDDWLDRSSGDQPYLALTAAPYHHEIWGTPVL